MGKIQSSETHSKAHVISIHAASLFRKKGFRATSMKDIALLMGVEASSLYNHIPGKPFLLHEICFSVAAAFEADVADNKKNNFDAAKNIEQLIRFHISMLLTKANEMYVANHEFKSLGEKELDLYLQKRKAYEKFFVSQIETAIQQKKLKTFEPNITAYTILAALRGLEFWNAKHTSTDPQQTADNIVQQLLTGIIL